MAIFIINCLSENSNDLHRGSRAGSCGRANSNTKASSSPLRSTSAAASASNTPAAYTPATAANGSSKKEEQTVRYTGSLAEQEMYGRMHTTRRCTRSFSIPRVVKTAAAVQPKPIRRGNTALPVSPTRASSPSA